MKKVVLITGASSGFGKFTAKELIKKGYTVYGAARRVEAMDDLVQAGGHALRMDVTNEASVSEAVNQIISEQGRIDVLVNNAGYSACAFVETADINQMKRMFEVNVWGLTRMTQHVLPHMRKQGSGRIVNVSSIVGKVGIAFHGFYSGSKHAVEALSDATRQEVERFGIRVSVVEPGVFSTGFEDVVLDELKSVEPGEAYQSLMDRFIPYFKNLYAEAPTPEPVVKAIVSAIETPKPKTRYAVGKDCKLAIFMKRLLSDHRFDRVVLKEMKMK